METKHTQGEWTPFIQKYPTNPKEIYTGVGVKSDTGYGAYFTMICDMMLPNGDDEYIKQHEEIKANAKLIAAAPELLRLAHAVVNGMKTRDELEIAAQQVIYKTKP